VPSDAPTLVSVALLAASCDAPAPVRVRDVAIALAMPKSVTTAVPPESRMFSGLMSRCTTPSPCAKARARARSRRMPIASGSAIGSPRTSRARSDSPRTNGIV
jgi:hypothetical protein